MSNDLQELLCERVRPDYSVRVFSEGFYKLVRFADGGRCFLVLRDHSQDQKHADKLYQSYCRAKTAVLDLGLCNHWEWFFTGTLSPEKWDRDRLDPFIQAFTQFIRDERKKGQDIKYLLIPERHEKGGWHIHGLLSGLGSSAVSEFNPLCHPVRLVAGGYRNWLAYSSRFGFCSLGPLRDRIAASFYITKYVSKDFAEKGNSGRGHHLYYCSQGLERSVKVGDIYGRQKKLDDLLTDHYAHCSVGYTEAPWWAFLEDMEVENVSIPFGEGSSDCGDVAPVVVPAGCPEWEEMQESLFAGVV